jgi:hypothetical protein
LPSDVTDPEPTRYLRWVRGVPLTLAPGLHELLIEYNPDGWAIREIGLDENGNVVHLYPSELHRWGDYGLLADGYPEIVERPIAFGDAVEMTAADFESVWARPPVEPPTVHQRHPGPDWPIRPDPAPRTSKGLRERLGRLRPPIS